MKKILIHLEASPQASVFDQITAYDAGVDRILAYGNVKPEQVTDLVYGGMFTRGVKDLHHTAVFIGGTNVAEAEALMHKAAASFFGPMRLSLMFDANGSNTTAAAMVHKIAHGRDLRGQKALILAGTGPVGIRAAILLAREGCQVYLSSRKLARAEEAAALIAANHGHTVQPVQAANDADVAALLQEGMEIVACCGAAGIKLINQDIWGNAAGLQILADINAVDPLGVEGIKVTDDGRLAAGKCLYGAIAIGNLKMKVHKKAIKRLFEQNDLVLDFDTIYDIAKNME
jgi:NADPH:quinone reductase-like Zn-dependent oxidoreductase